MYNYYPMQSERGHGDKIFSSTPLHGLSSTKQDPAVHSLKNYWTVRNLDK